ncbi:hypothetical protein [Lactococcus lactis]|uniref:hypothetical protein n=1 Tax=Lactococcus lactis TaxID=1358 RepID=UPI00223AE381|nr:hypothetical protein [Lactococcus lactis]MCT1174553.1 hypothetical protein [Lactococcus lactis]
MTIQQKNSRNILANITIGDLPAAFISSELQEDGTMILTCNVNNPGLFFSSEDGKKDAMAVFNESIDAAKELLVKYSESESIN